MRSVRKTTGGEVQRYIPAYGFRAEDDLIVCCARSRLSPEMVTHIRDLAHGNLDWSYVQKLAGWRGVGALVYAALKQASPRDLRRRAVRALEEEYYRRSAHHIRLATELIQLLERFDEQDIPALVYKGPALAVSLYGNPALRGSSDLDLLLRPADVERAGEILIGLGYRRLVHQDGGVAYVMSEQPLWVELHTAITPRFFPLELAFDRLWPNRVPVTLVGREVWTVGAEDLLLILTAHGSQHCWERLDWISDIAELVRTEPDIDWEEVLRRAKTLGSQRMALLGLRLADEILGCALPAGIQRRIGADRAIPALVRQVREFVFSPKANPVFDAAPSVHAFRLRVRERWRHRMPYLRYCCRYYAVLLFSPTMDDVRAVRLPRSLDFLYHVVRPLRLMAKYVRIRLLRGARVTRQEPAHR